LVARPEAAEAWALKAGLLARQGQVAQAQLLYRQALKVDPSLVQAHAALIGSQLTQHDITAASASLAAMRQTLPEHPQTRWFSVQLALARGELGQADAELQPLLKAAPDNVMLLQAAGATALQLDRPAQAERQLARALQLAPDAASVRRLLAQTQMAQGQTQRALDTLAPLLLAGSRDAAALALAAQAQLLLDQRPAAQALFDRAAALAPDDPRLRTARALVQLGQAGAGSGQRANADQLAQGLAELQAVASADSGTGADVALITAQLQARRWDAALVAVDRLARKLPDRPLPAMLRGQVLLARPDRAGARAAFEQALVRDPSHLPAAAALGRLDLAEQQPARAQARFEAMLKAAADNPTRQTAVRLALADLLARSGAPADAVTEVLAAAVKASPTDLAAQLALVDHHLAHRDGRRALQAAQSAAALAPDEPELLLRLGRSQLLAGEPRQAASSFSRLSTQQPGLVAGWQGLIDAQLVSQDLTGAANTAKRAISALPQSVAAQRLAIVVALRQQQPSAALAVARQVQAQRPQEAVGFLLEGEVQIAQQQWPAAVAALRQGLGKREPGQTPARLHHALLKASEPAAAATLAQRRLREHPDDLLFQHYLGDLALARRDWPQALQHYQAVLAAQPDHGVALNNVAWVLLQQGQHGALDLARRAVRALPGQAGPLDTLGAALAAAGQLAPAIEALQQASALAPGDGALHLHLARLYQRAKRLDEAVAEIDRALAAGGQPAQQAEARALKAELAAR
jgi:putative PEP-CTERM system TPR-repeat lipoprotein